MKNKTKLLACSILALFGIVVALAAYDPWPAKDAMDAARAHAEREGVQDGGICFAQFITQPDALGGCEVEVSFGSAVMRLRRSWRFGEWQVTDLNKKQFQTETD